MHRRVWAMMAAADLIGASSHAVLPEDPWQRLHPSECLPCASSCKTGTPPAPATHNVIAFTDGLTCRSAILSTSLSCQGRAFFCSMDVSRMLAWLPVSHIVSYVLEEVLRLLAAESTPHW